MKTLISSSLAAVAGAVLIACSSVADTPEVDSGVMAAEAAVETSLYERLGGYEAISAVANDFAEKLFIDPQVGQFFKGMGTDTRKSFIQKNINLICNVTGAPGNCSTTRRMVPAVLRVCRVPKTR